jgi:hypothetical protein
LEVLVAQRQQAQRLTLPSLRRQAKSLARRLEGDLAQFQAQLQELRRQAAQLDQWVQKLEAITGVGTTTALGVLAELPELGTLNRQQTAALAPEDLSIWDIGGAGQGLESRVQRLELGHPRSHTISHSLPVRWVRQ